MRKIILVYLALLFIASYATAEGGWQGTYMDDLSDVDSEYDSRADKDILYWNDTLKTWVSGTITTVGGSTFLKLDQTTPQTISNGAPIFNAGATVNGTLDLTGVTADVSMFDDTVVGNAVDGYSSYVKRHAAEGDDYLRFYIGNDRWANIYTASYLSIDTASLILNGTSNANVAIGSSWNVPGTSPGLFLYGAIGGVIKFIEFQINNSNLELTRSDAAVVACDVQFPLILSNGATSSGKLTIKEDSTDGTNEATFMVPALAADTDYVLPADDGDNGEQLTTDGSGNLTWEAAGGGSATAYDDIGDPDAATTIAFADTETITYTTDSDGETFFTINDTDADLAGATTLLKLSYVDDSDADGNYLECVDDSGATPDSVFKIAADGATTAGTIACTTVDTGSGAVDLGDAAVANGDTNSVPTGDQVYDFCETTQAYYNAIGDLPTAAVTNGDTTHISTADAIYDFCETTQAYYNSGDSPTFGTITSTANIAGNPKHLRFTIIDPLATQTEDNEICIWNKTDANLTITSIEVSLDSNANEILGDLKFADTFIGLANATVIESFDTTSGVRSDSSMSGDATVPAGKCLYISFDSAPNTAIHQANFDITWDYD